MCFRPGIHLAKSPPPPFWRSGRRRLIWCGREASSVNPSFQPNHVSADGSRLRAERGWALQRRAAIPACECTVPPHCRAGIWECLCSFPRDDVLQSGGSGFSARSLLCQGLQNPPSQEAEGGLFFAQAGWRLSRWKGGLLGGCCGSMEACEEERDGDDETPVFEVLSLKEK